MLGLRMATAVVAALAAFAAKVPAALAAGSARPEHESGQESAELLRRNDTTSATASLGHVGHGTCPCASACASAGCSDPCCPCVPGTCVVRPGCGRGNGGLPQYLLFTRPEFGVGNPSTHTADFLREVAKGLNASRSPDGSLLVGNELIFSLLNDNPDLNATLTALRAVCAASEASGVPVSLVLDCENWWDARPDLWNWFDPSLPGYNASNAANVEWFGPTRADAAKIGWRDWGSQIRVKPQQNILSPAVLEASSSALRTAAGVVATWFAGLAPERKHLLASVKIGWEAGVQYNSYYYENGNNRLGKNASGDPNFRMNFSKGIGGGLPILGYAAASTPAAKAAGVAVRPGVPLSAADVSAMTRAYVDSLEAVAVAAGVPPERVVNHVGGQQPVPGSRPLEPVIPYEAGFTTLGVPGYSWYWAVPGPLLVGAMKGANRTRWAASEWNLRGGSEAAWYSDFVGTLTVLDCAHIAVYNWDNDFSKQADGQAAVRRILNEWTWDRAWRRH